MIDKGKQYKTRDGREVRIYATDGAGSHPIHGAIECSDGWINASWGSSGYFISTCRDMKEDLVEVKPRIKIERWYLFNRNGDYSIWQSKPDASTTNAFAIKFISLEVEEGEGLDAV